MGPFFSPVAGVHLKKKGPIKGPFRGIYFEGEVRIQVRSELGGRPTIARP